MQIALCNEVVRDLPFARQCELAASLGYDGLELAPFTFGEEPHLMPASQRIALRRTMVDAGLGLSGLHWLLVAPAGLSITDAEAAPRTLDVIERLVALCADLGGTRMIHGSPAQRRLPEHDTEAARQRALAILERAAKVSQQAGLIYCLEPLAPADDNFATSVAQAASIVDEIGHPALRTMIDTCAAAAEAEPTETLAARWLPTGMIAHIHLNDPNRRAPGQGGLRFAPLLSTLNRLGYGGWLGVEPFDYHPDGLACAARAIGYLRGLLEQPA